MATAREVPRRTHRVVGRNVPKVDGRRKTTGRATYASDIQADDLLHGAVVRAPRAHARIRSVDTAAAESIPGVRAVIARTDLLGAFDDTVRHFGDVVAAVAATDPRTARRAAAAVEFDLEPLPAVFDPREALDADAPRVQDPDPVGLLLHELHDVEVENDAYANDHNIDDYHRFEAGDVDAGLESADHVVRGTFQTPRVKQCNLDTHCCVAEWVGDRLVLVDSLTSPDPARESLAGFLGMDPEDVSIRPPDTASSSFGGHALLKPSFEPVAASLARATDAAVKLWFGRDEEFVATDTRHPVRYEITMGASDAGRITALDVTAIADTGPYPNGVGHIVLANSEGRIPEIYAIDDYRFEGVSVFTNNLIAGEYRGIGSVQIGFAIECHVDELIREAGFDPLEFRRANFVEPGDVPVTTGQPITSCGIRECLDRGWARFDELRVGDVPDPATRVGWGVATATHTTGPAMTGDDSSEARIRLGADGLVHASTSAVDQGQGSDTVLAQLVAEVTGIRMDGIVVERFPTDDDIEGDLGSIASRTTWLIGTAVADAAEQLAGELRDRAADRLGVDPDAVELAAGEAAGGGETVPIADLFEPGDAGRLEFRGHATSDRRPPGYGAHFAEVAVDVETGAVDVLTFVAAQDVGYAIHPRMVEGQIEGSLLHGLEFALHSELKLDAGSPLNATLADYPVASPIEMPDRVAVELVESDEESGPYGAKGVGTTSTPPVAPALCNALRDATGTRFRAPPVDGEAVLEGVR